MIGAVLMNPLLVVRDLVAVVMLTAMYMLMQANRGQLSHARMVRQAAMCQGAQQGHQHYRPQKQAG
jgi:hypothetical protein